MKLSQLLGSCLLLFSVRVLTIKHGNVFALIISVHSLLVNGIFVSESKVKALKLLVVCNKCLNAFY